MQLHELVNTFGQDLKQRHGQKIHKLSIHGAFTCPNRDGTLGRGGCTFCNVSSFADESAQQLAGMFRENFEQYAGHVAPEVLAAGPDPAGD